MLIWISPSDSQHLLGPADTVQLLIVFCRHGIHSFRWHRPITWSPSLGSSKSFKLIIPSCEACCGLTPFPSTTACLFNSRLQRSEDQRSSTSQVKWWPTLPGWPHATEETAEQNWRVEGSSQFIFSERFHFVWSKLLQRNNTSGQLQRLRLMYLFLFSDCKYRSNFAADCRKNHQHVFVSRLSTIFSWSLTIPSNVNSKHCFWPELFASIIPSRNPAPPLITLTNLSQSD